MPYGKYKGTLIADLPGNYLNWFAKVGFPSGRLGRQLALMHEIDHNGLGHLLQPLRELAHPGHAVETANGPAARNADCSRKGRSS